MAESNSPKASTPRGDSRGETVTVACKLPHGVELRAYAMVEKTEVIPHGSRQVMQAEPLPGSFTVAGAAFPEGRGAAGPMHYGFALTSGCPKELWERWLEANKDSPMVRNGLIFAFASEADAIAKSRENERQRTGLERLDPTKLPGNLQKADKVAT